MSLERYLTIKRGFDGLSHSFTLLQAAIESMAVFPDPPAPYNTKGIVEAPAMYSLQISSF